MNVMRPPGPVTLVIEHLRGGGAERNMLRLAGALHARGIEITVVAVDASERVSAWVPPDVDVLDLARTKLESAILPLARLIRTSRPRAVISAGSAVNVITVMARSLARSSARVIVTERNTQSSQRADAVTLRRRHITPALMRRTYRRANAIVAVSDGVADDLARFLHIDRSDIITIPNPIVHDDFADKESQPLPAPWNRRVGDAELVLSAGRLVAHKDHETLLRAFAHVRESRVNVKLAILGEGEEGGRLRQLVEDLALGEYVLFPGFQENPFPWMHRATVFALTSQYEGLPTVLIEALACGARVVATDCPSGPAEILDGGRWGSLVPVADVDATAQALTKELDSGRWPVRPDVAVDPYRTGTVVDQYLSVLERTTRT